MISFSTARIVVIDSSVLFQSSRLWGSNRYSFAGFTGWQGLAAVAVLAGVWLANRRGVAARTVSATEA